MRRAAGAGIETSHAGGVATLRAFGGEAGTTCGNALRLAAERGCRTAAMPMLGTGYGPLTPEDFARGLRDAVAGTDHPVERLTVVVRKAEDRESIQRVLG